MIDAKDLRLGNWADVYDYFNGTYAQMQITASHIKYIENGECRCNPIELTPEILEKAGFEKQTEDIFGSVWYKLGEVGITEEFTLIGQVMPPMHSVHQLQNLFYAISGEELEINLQ